MSAPATASRWLNQQPWRNGPLVMGACVVVHCMALVMATSVYSRVRSRFYLSLIVIVVTSLWDLLCSATDSGEPVLTFGRALWFIASWVSCVGFTLQNYVRYTAVLRTRHPITRISLGVLIVVPIALYTLFTVQMFVLLSLVKVFPIGMFAVPAFTMNVWGVVDAVVNAIISYMFTRTLSSPDSRGMVLRVGFDELLLRVKVMLAVECIFITVTSLMAILLPAFDPQGIVQFLAQGVRLQVYCTFLNALNKILRRPNLNLNTSSTNLINRHNVSAPARPMRGQIGAN
ncbi:hypothetical protein RI367_002558 [Sorochytrium milnesiophthora]